jgi:hypothetical protein
MEKTFIFIYAKDGKIKALDILQSKIQHETLLKEEWLHTATLDACVFLEYLHNNCDDATFFEYIKSLSGKIIKQLKINIMKKYTEKDLVDFGNQLLSKDREVTEEDLEKFNKSIKKVEVFFYNSEKEMLDSTRKENRRLMMNEYLAEQKANAREKKENASFDLVIKCIIAFNLGSILTNIFLYFIS